MSVAQLLCLLCMSYPRDDKRQETENQSGDGTNGADADDGRRASLSEFPQNSGAAEIGRERR